MSTILEWIGSLDSIGVPPCDAIRVWADAVPGKATLSNRELLMHPIDFDAIVRETEIATKQPIPKSPFAGSIIGIPVVFGAPS